MPDVLTDLLEIATYVYSADQAVTRGGDGVVNHGQNWRRRLKFHIGVRVPEIWSRPEVKGKMEEALGFLSEDEYEFDFSKQTTSVPVDQYLSLENEPSTSEELDSVMLFSGGLDSLAGSVVEGVREQRRVALVSHRSNSKIDNKQHRLVRDLTKVCANKPFHIPVWANKDRALGREHTQRSRSFLFACLGLAVARMYKLNKLRFYENGVVSLNLPISEQIVGARATRTTHPQVLNGLAQLFSTLVESDFVVENPFLWLTKSEVVDVIGDSGCAGLIAHSVSCTHTIDQTIQHTHCGRCSQCISRRFGTLASKYGDSDPAGMYKVDLLEGAREKGVDLTLVESFIRTAFDMKDLNAYQLIEKFGEVGRVLRHVRGFTADEVAARVIRLHQQHAGEVAGVMERALASNATRILEEKLPPTCAIILAVPGKYRVPIGTKRDKFITDCEATTSCVNGKTRDSSQPYSGRDDKIYVLVGNEAFQTLTNEEIEKRFRGTLRPIWGRRKTITLDAVRASLNRIRRHHKLPLSQDIVRKAVNQ